MPVTILELAGKFAGIVVALSYVPYIVGILRRKAHPNRASWFIWACTNFLIAGSYYLSGAKDTLWVSLAFMAGSSVIAILAIWFGEEGWALLDKSCLIGAGLNIALWFIFKNPQVILFVAISNVFLGMLPTFKKTYLRPQSEPKLAWVMCFIGSIANIIAIDNWNFSIATYPIVTFFEVGIVVFLLFLSPHREVTVKS
jgi:hypothetical protein